MKRAIICATLLLALPSPGAAFFDEAISALEAQMLERLVEAGGYSKEQIECYRRAGPTELSLQTCLGFSADDAAEAMAAVDALLADINAEEARELEAYRGLLD